MLTIPRSFASYFPTQAFAGICAENGLDTVEGSQEGDDHSFLFVFDRSTEEAYLLDLPFSRYETGGGYNWRKIPGVIFSETDIDIIPVDYNDAIPEDLKESE